MILCLADIVKLMLISQYFWIELHENYYMFVLVLSCWDLNTIPGSYLTCVGPARE